MLYLVAPIFARTKKQQTSNEGGRVLRIGRGQLKETGSTSTAPPAATNRSTFSRQHRLKDLSIIRRDIYPIENKYGEDARPQNQMSAAQEQHKGLCSILQGASVTLHTILLGVGGTIYSNHPIRNTRARVQAAVRVKPMEQQITPNLQDCASMRWSVEF